MKINKNKKIHHYLKNLCNFNIYKSKIISNDLCFGYNIKFKDLDSAKIVQIHQWLEKNKFKTKK